MKKPIVFISHITEEDIYFWPLYTHTYTYTPYTYTSISHTSYTYTQYIMYVSIYLDG